MASAELSRLLAELKRAASPVQRMKLVARAWRSVRRLAPKERADLAAEVGLEGAEELLERMASRGGSRLSPSLLLKALERIRETDAAEVRDAVDAMRDPRRRSELVHKAAAALAPEPEPPPAPAPAANEVEPPPPPEIEPQPEPVPEPVAIETAPPPPPPPVAARAPQPTPPPPPPNDGGLTDRIARLSSPTSRFRTLRADLEDLRGLPVEPLQRLLELFPAGWQRRRALQTLLRAGIPASAEQALALIERLESDRARRWCASILLDRRDLSDRDREELIRRHGLFRPRFC